MHDWGMNQWFINAPFGLAALFGGFIAVALLWSIVWKGLGLWHASRNGDYLWFIAMLVINTVGILEIVYIFGVAKMRFEQLFTKGPHHHRHHSN